MQTEAALRSKAAHEAEERARSLRTVEKLLNNYLDNMRARGKISTGSVANEFNNLLRDYPALADRDAASVTPLEWVGILRRYGKTDGHTDKMRKLRSYLRSAYSTALRADLDPLQDASAGMMLTTNPIDGIPAGTSRARDRNLSEQEFRALWARLRADSHPLSLALQALILLGGQRYTQLIRATVRDYQDGELTLYDPKGRRATPRKHVLPVQGMAKGLLDEFANRSALLGTDLLFTITGAGPALLDSASRYITDLSKAMVERGEATDTFRLSDIRRSLETIMSGKLRISKDDRAQLMSHGVSGVQDKHYDKSAHMDAKAEALAKLERWLVQDTAIVVPLRAGGAG
jgi:integrase